MKNFFLIFLVVTCQALRHELYVSKDRRYPVFEIESFGFGPDGTMTLDLSSFSVEGASDEDLSKMAFRLRSSLVQEFSLFGTANTVSCDDESLTSTASKYYYTMWLVDDESKGIKAPKTWEFSVSENAPGLEGYWELEFINCARKPVTLDAVIEMKNGDSYLSYGRNPIGWVLLGFCLIYVVLLAVWIKFGLLRTGARVFRIHHLMTLLVALKICTLFFQSVEMHYLRIQGHAGIFAFMYFFFAFLKGLLLFTVIVLIGSGWSFVKPFLSDRERTIFLIVVPLQVLANFADVVVEETAPGSSGWFIWRNLFRLLDLACCLFVLLPISWSIRRLRESANENDKAKRNLIKLELFRQFYATVMAYIYLTRFLLLLFAATLPYQFVWVATLMTELCTLIFFSITGYSFRPMDENPYLYVHESDDEIELEVIDPESDNALAKPVQLD